MKKIRTTAAIGVVLMTATCFVANAQTPRNSVERNVSAMCTKADFDGDSFRPFVCDPRCTCSVETTVLIAAAVTACQEGPVGNFVADLLLSQGVCDIGPGTASVCSNLPASGEPCDCSCGGTPPECLPITCSSCSDPDENCADPTLDPGDGQCAVLCGVDADCTVTGQIQVGGLGDGSDETRTATCSVPDASPVSLNPNDARACIAHVETAFGQPCTPFSP